MERRNWFVVLTALTILPLTGCGSSDTPAPGAKPSTISATTPDKAVFQFLEAVRLGNDATASQMLTNLARQKTAEMQLVVAPPGSDTAKFSVGEVEFLGETGAHVASTWTDIVDDGQAHTDTIVWILRKDPEGWRIAGMGTKLFDDSPPLLLNFEDPEDMIRKQRMAEEEMARRSQPAGTQPPAGQTGGLPPGGGQPGNMQANRTQPNGGQFNGVQQNGMQPSGVQTGGYQQPGGYQPPGSYQPPGGYPQGAGQPAASQAQKIAPPATQPERK